MNIDKDIEIEFVKEKIEECTRIIQSVSNMESKKAYSKERMNFKKVLNLIENKDKELEKYKKIAEKLADELDKITEEIAREKGIHYVCKFCNSCSDIECQQCILEWARKEVLKDE